MIEMLGKEEEGGEREKYSRQSIFIFLLSPLSTLTQEEGRERRRRRRGESKTFAAGWQDADRLPLMLHPAKRKKKKKNMNEGGRKI